VNIVLSNVLWGIVFISFIVFMFYWDNKKKKKSYQKLYREKTEQEKELEKQIEIEKGKNRRPPWGGPGGF
jgi:uncharacterized membrane protein